VLCMEDKLPCVIRTFTGKLFNVLEPNPEDVDVRDIAHALSNQCRFTGHTNVFYSVAEHSERASHLVPEHLALCTLLHDATEAYLVDLPRPIKSASNLGVIFKQMENVIWSAIARRFDLPDPLPKEVKIADAQMLRTEKRDLMNVKDDAWYLNTWVDADVEPLKSNIIPLALPFQAEQAFLDRFHVLISEVYHPRCV
jgi:uncharacterized protein